MSRSFVTVIIPVFLLMLVGCSTVSAAGLTYQGTVVGMDKTAGTLAVNTTGSLYIISPMGMESQIAYSPQDPSTVTKKVPDSQVFGLVKTGDAVRVTTPGFEETRWSVIAGIPDENHIANPVLWLVGQPDHQMIPEYRGGFQVLITETPNCTHCSGSSCAVSDTTVKIVKDKKTIASSSLTPGGTYKTPAGTPGGAITVQFLRGEALPSACVREAPQPAGTAPVSVYMITTSQVAAAAPTKAQPFLSMTVQPEPFLIGNTIYVRGQALRTNLSKVYLVLEGPGLDTGGVMLDDITQKAVNGAFTEVPVDAATGEYSYAWETAGLAGKILPGSYTIHVLSRPVDLKNPESAGILSTRTAITLSPKITLTPRSTLPAISPTQKASPLSVIPGIALIIFLGILGKKRG